MTLVAERLKYRYPAQSVLALNGVSLTITPGEVTWLTGRLGSGTSTFLLAAAGLAPRLSGGEREGVVTVDGGDPARHSPLASAIAYLAPSPALQLSGIAATVADEIAVGPMNLGLSRDVIAQRVHGSMARFAIDHLGHRHPAQLSGGETQRVVLAALHASQPRIWLLDEPFSALDLGARRALGVTLGALAREGHVIVIASDDADTMQPIADRMVLFADGCVVLDGATDAMLAGDGVRSHGACSTDAASLGADGGIAAPRPVTIAALLDACPTRPQVRLTIASPAVTPVEPVLQFDAVGFRYSHDNEVLQAASFTLGRGEAAGLFGTNGAGKSTILRLAMALAQPTAGLVRVLGELTTARHPEDLAPRVAMVFQQPERQLFAMSVAAECRLGAELAGWPRARVNEAVDRALLALGLTDVAGEHPGDLPLPRRRLVAIAASLATNPELLLLDEPTAGLDRPSRQLVVAVVRSRTARGLATLAVTHDPLFAHEALDRSFVVADRIIVEVTPSSRVFDDIAVPIPAALALARAWGLAGEDQRHSHVAALLMQRHER